jgi:hypothetical protein
MSMSEQRENTPYKRPLTHLHPIHPGSKLSDTHLMRPPKRTQREAADSASPHRRMRVRGPKLAATRALAGASRMLGKRED